MRLFFCQLFSDSGRITCFSFKVLHNNPRFQFPSSLLTPFSKIYRNDHEFFMMIMNLLQTERQSVQQVNLQQVKCFTSIYFKKLRYFSRVCVSPESRFPERQFPESQFAKLPVSRKRPFPRKALSTHNCHDLIHLRVMNRSI